jgi:hypothetical protein
MKTLEAQLDETLQTDRLIALLSGAFGMAAALLASIGLYGVMAFVVARRNKELGIRLALGASRGGVLWLVMREVTFLLVIGLVAGGLTAALTTWLLDHYFKIDLGLYQVGLFDGWVASAALLLLATVAALAGLIPAQRARRINPIMTLRYESRPAPASSDLPEVTRQPVAREERSHFVQRALAPRLLEVPSVPIARERPQRRHRQHGALRQGVARAPAIDVGFRVERLERRAGEDDVVPPRGDRRRQMEDVGGRAQRAAFDDVADGFGFAADAGRDLGVGLQRRGDPERAVEAVRPIAATRRLHPARGRSRRSSARARHAAPDRRR